MTTGWGDSKIGATASGQTTSGLGRLVCVLLSAASIGIPCLEEARGAWPIPSNHRLENGVLVRNVPVEPGQRGRTGLEKPFPEMVQPSDNPTTPAKVELGRLLFFDPILSGSKKLSCAHCHHPDLALTDGLRLGMGAGATGFGDQRTGGIELNRNTPTLLNAAYHARQFWDGRAISLEQQAREVLTARHEMAADPKTAVRDLSAIQTYRDLFAESFGEDGDETVTFLRVTQALAAFERTLVTYGSRFDRYAAGDRSALTKAERRGLALFRSVKTRCFECHTPPTFSSPDMKVIGLPDDSEDPARGRPFKVPTLRNVALTAPYMHNGSLATLEDVIDFYAKDGGRGAGRPIKNQDGFVLGFPLSDQERSDLVAFLHALTDQPLDLPIPERAVSGLAVVGRLKPTRVAAATPAKRGEKAAKPAAGTRVLVRAGESIQDALDSVEDNVEILVEPGVYNETVMVDFSGIKLRGLIVDGRRPVLDGRGKLADAVVGSGDDLLIEGFRIENYTGNGVVVSGAKNLTIRDLVIRDTGAYGVYPVTSTNVLIERCVVTGIWDAAVYVGQSRDVVVRGCEVYGNVAGIEIENCVDALVTNNSAYDNTMGILVFVLPNLPLKVGENTRVIGNRVMNNNRPNFGKPGTLVGSAPPGVGITIMAADNATVTANEVWGNDSIGISVISLKTAYPDLKATDIEPNPDGNRVFDNELRDNGGKVTSALKEAGIPGVDLFWDGTGTGNGWDEKAASRAPEKLPPIARNAAQ